MDAFDTMLASRQDISALLQKNLSKAQARMNAITNTKCREVVFEVRSWSYGKLHPYKQVSVCGKKYNNLIKQFYSPYQILARVGPIAYIKKFTMFSIIEFWSSIMGLLLLKWIHCLHS